MRMPQQQAHSLKGSNGEDHAEANDTTRVSNIGAPIDNVLKTRKEDSSTGSTDDMCSSSSKSDGAASPGDTDTKGFDSRGGDDAISRKGGSSGTVSNNRNRNSSGSRASINNASKKSVGKVKNSGVSTEDVDIVISADDVDTSGIGSCGDFDFNAKSAKEGEKSTGDTGNTENSSDSIASANDKVKNSGVSTEDVLIGSSSSSSSSSKKDNVISADDVDTSGTGSCGDDVDFDDKSAKKSEKSTGDTDNTATDGNTDSSNDSTVSANDTANINNNTDKSNASGNDHAGASADATANANDSSSSSSDESEHEPRRHTLRRRAFGAALGVPPLDKLQVYQCDSEQDGAAVEERPQAGSDLERQMIEELPHTEAVPESIAEFKREDSLVGEQPGVHGSVSEYERMKTIMGPMFPRRNEEVQAAAAAAATAANEYGADGSDMGNANKSKDKKMKKKMNSKKKRKGGNGKHNRSSKTKKDSNNNNSNKGEETGGQAARDGWTRRGVWWWNFIVTQIIVNIYAFAIWKAGSRSVRVASTTTASTATPNNNTTPSALALAKIALVERTGPIDPNLLTPTKAAPVSSSSSSSSGGGGGSGSISRNEKMSWYQPSRTAAATTTPTPTTAAAAATTTTSNNDYDCDNYGVTSTPPNREGTGEESLQPSRGLQQICQRRQRLRIRWDALETNFEKTLDAPWV